MLPTQSGPQQGAALLKLYRFLRTSRPYTPTFIIIIVLVMGASHSCGAPEEDGGSRFQVAHAAEVHRPVSGHRVSLAVCAACIGVRHGTVVHGRRIRSVLASLHGTSYACTREGEKKGDVFGVGVCNALLGLITGIRQESSQTTDRYWQLAYWTRRRCNGC